MKFSTETWVALAKTAGVKYLVVTTKHNDGFCLWGTKQTDFNIVKATPFGRDPFATTSAEGDGRLAAKSTRQYTESGRDPLNENRQSGLGVAV